LVYYGLGIDAQGFAGIAAAVAGYTRRVFVDGAHKPAPAPRLNNK
jgi:hypothetical protein